MEKVILSQWKSAQTEINWNIFRVNWKRVLYNTDIVNILHHPDSGVIILGVDDVIYERLQLKPKLSLNHRHSSVALHDKSLNTIECSVIKLWFFSIWHLFNWISSLPILSPYSTSCHVIIQYRIVIVYPVHHRRHHWNMSNNTCQLNRRVDFIIFIE